MIENLPQTYFSDLSFAGGGGGNSGDGGVV